MVNKLKDKVVKKQKKEKTEIREYERLKLKYGNKGETNEDKK